METIGIGAFLLLFTVAPYVWFVKRGESKNRDAFTRSEQTGLNEPPSLHPSINPDACLCSGACVKACPEKGVLGIVDGQVQLIHASRCIGHGACADACPVSAIDLVFGTATRGVDIPVVSSDFETNVPNLYIVGELGGMGLIRNAIVQGKQVVEHLAKQPRQTNEEILDVLIVGAGPAGLAASLEAKRLGMRFATIEQGEAGGAIRHYPRKKLVMTHPMEIPLYGQVNTKQMLKEELIALVEKIVSETGLMLNTHEKVLSIDKREGIFDVETDKGFYQAQNVVLAIGRRGTPRKLGVEGEDLTKVSYGLLEPEQFQQMDLLIVGGGDSALEAACALAEEPGNRVVVSYRREQFQRPKEDVRARYQALEDQGKIKTVYSSRVVLIAEDHCVVEETDRRMKIKNDHVFIFAGGELPTGFLEKIGVQVETKYGTA